MRVLSLLVLALILVGCSKEETVPSITRFTYPPEEVVRVGATISDDDVTGLTRYEEFVAHSQEWKTGVSTTGVYRVKSDRRTTLTTVAEMLIDNGYKYLYDSENSKWAYFKGANTVEFVIDANSYVYIIINGNISQD